MAAWSEKQLQNYLWANRDKWRKLIDPLPTIITQTSRIDVSNISPEKLLWKLVCHRIGEIYEDVIELSLLGKEVHVAPFGRSAMRMDFFAVPGEWGSPALGVVELKADRQSSRESFTELLGYGQGLLLMFPGLCRNDLLHVLVAPLSAAPAIVRRAFAAALVFDRRRVLALEPIFDSPTPGHIRLRPWIPKQSDLALLSRMAFQENNFYAAVQVWEGDADWWDEISMNSVAARAALTMEAEGIHGFVFTSRAYADLPLPNAITCVGLNPFSLAKQKYPIPRDIPKTIHVDQLGILDLRFSDVIASLQRSPKAGSFADNVAAAESVWSSHLTKIAYETVKRAVRSAKAPFPQTDHGHFTWDGYLQSSETRATQYDVMPTGLLRELYDLVVENDYRVFARKGEHPILGDDFPMHAEEALRSHWFFREFLRRMLEGPAAGLW